MSPSPQSRCSASCPRLFPFSWYLHEKSVPRMFSLNLDRAHGTGGGRRWGWQVLCVLEVCLLFYQSKHTLIVVLHTRFFKSANGERFRRRLCCLVRRKHVGVIVDQCVCCCSYIGAWGAEGNRSSRFPDLVICVLIF